MVGVKFFYFLLLKITRLVLDEGNRGSCLAVQAIISLKNFVEEPMSSEEVGRTDESVIKVYIIGLKIAEILILSIKDYNKIGYFYFKCQKDYW